MRKEWDRNQIGKALVHALIACYGIACLWLYYNQSVAVLTDSGNGPFQSDLPLHLSMILEDGWYYSFTAFVYQFLDVVCFGNTIGVAVFLTMISVATVYATDALLEEFGMGENGFLRLLLAFSVNFVMPCFVSSVGEFRYVSYQSGNIWHNSTYICMRFVAILTLICYWRLEKKYREGITLKEWLTFALLNVICTGIKPSFLVVYSPIVGLFLLLDLFQKVSFKRILIFGSALLPSGLVILWQNLVLFGAETGSSIEIGPWVNFSQHTAIPKVAVILSVLFCVLTLAYTVCEFLIGVGREKTSFKNKLSLCLEAIKGSKKEMLVILMTVVGFMEALLFVESGYRSAAGNFLWGYYFGIFVTFAMCARIWVSMGQTLASRIGKAFLAVSYGWHLYCGLYFFVMLVSGVGYFM